MQFTAHVLHDPEGAKGIFARALEEEDGAGGGRAKDGNKGGEGGNAGSEKGSEKGKGWNPDKVGYKEEKPESDDEAPQTAPVVVEKRSSKMSDLKRYEVLLAAASFCQDDLEDYELASVRCREAIKLNPKEPRAIATYATLLYKHHKVSAVVVQGGIWNLQSAV